MKTFVAFCVVALCALQIEGEKIGTRDVFKGNWTIGDGYRTYCVGNCQEYGRVSGPVPPANQSASGVAFMGGNMNQGHPGADEAFRWLGDRAGNGSMVLIKTIEPDDGTLRDCWAYNEWIYNETQVSSVTTLCLESQIGCFQGEVISILSRASGIFLQGGNQAHYFNWFSNSPILNVLYDLVALGRPFGGSSAGLASLGNFMYTAEFGSETSKQALRNPFNFEITLTNKFLDLPCTKNAITDTHFYQNNTWTEGAPVRGLGVSEESAILLDGNTCIGKFVGPGPVYMLLSPSPAPVCEPKTPLTTTPYKVFKYIINETNPKTTSFNFNTWSGTGGVYYTLQAVNGVLNSTQPGGSVY